MIEMEKLIKDIYTTYTSQLNGIIAGIICAFNGKICKYCEGYIPEFYSGGKYVKPRCNVDLKLSNECKNFYINEEIFND